MSTFDLTKEKRQELALFTLQLLEDHYSNVAAKRVAPVLDVAATREYVRQFELESGIDFDHALKALLEGLDTYQVHTPHPSYYGLYNPRTTFPSILADLITAVYNPSDGGVESLAICGGGGELPGESDCSTIWLRIAASRWNIYLGWGGSQFDCNSVRNPTCVSIGQGRRAWLC